MTTISLKTILAAGIAAATIALTATPSSAMNKGQMVNAMSAETGLSKSQTVKVLNSFFSQITKALGKSDKVTLVGFGTFSVTGRDGRTGTNPRTGKPIEITGKKDVGFKADKKLTAAVNK